MFDHIGFVSSEEHNKICDNAKKMEWEVKVGERRTFITTPYEFKIELQINSDVIDPTTDITEIEELKMVTKMKVLEKDLSLLFSQPIKNISSVVGDEVTIKEAVIKGVLSTKNVDPNGVRVFDCV